jgi:signal transduction histidine kinase
VRALADARAFRMTPTDLMARLASHRTVGSAPREELEWLATHGHVRHLAAGDLLSTNTAPVEGMFVVLSGRIALFVDRGAGRQKAIEWREGDVSGLLPYSRMINAPGDAVAQEPTTVLAVHRDHLKTMTRECYGVTALLVHTMVDRARTFTSSDLHNEKLLSLGKLSAGLAHELNNPVAAIERGASLLEDRLEDAERAARVLGAARLSEAQLAALDGVRAACLATSVQGVRSPIQQAEREEAISGWLDAHGLDVSTAEALAETAVTVDALNHLAGAVEGPALDAVLRWTGSGCAVRRLASEIQEAATRVSGLVLAIKGFTHMDQASIAEAVDLRQGLDNTIAVLRAKARGKAASVIVDLPPALPRVRGYVGELNQIWSNLIDNALDAIPDAGRVEIRATRDDGRVVVSVVDNGSGIPDHVRQRIFDPFFTTKPMGQGTGLGLDIVRRLVRHNDGEIEVASHAGRTEFRVSLPIAEPDSDRGPS